MNNRWLFIQNLTTLGNNKQFLHNYAMFCDLKSALFVNRVAVIEEAMQLIDIVNIRTSLYENLYTNNRA